MESKERVRFFMVFIEWFHLNMGTRPAGGKSLEKYKKNCRMAKPFPEARLVGMGSLQMQYQRVSTGYDRSPWQPARISS